MSDDSRAGLRPETGVGGPEASLDERWAHRMSGAAWHTAMIGGIGMALLLTGAWSARGFMVVSPPVPWSASYALVTLVAVAGMAIAARARGPGTAAVGAMGAVLLLAGGAASRLLLGETRLPPWGAVALTAAVGGAAIAGMVVMGRWIQGSARIRQPHGPQVSSRPETARSAPATLDRFQVDSQGGRKVVEASTVEWFEANGNYARLHRASDSFLFRMSLRELERKLDAELFLRVHRSAIVNLDHVRRVEPMPSGDAELVLASGARVRMSRRYAKAFHERTGR
jgi:hypothetical protein